MAGLALIAEIGPQVCRFALMNRVEGERPVFTHYAEIPVSEHPDVLSTFRAYCRGLGQQPLPKVAGLAIFASVNGDRFTITQTGWSFSKAEIADAFGFERVIVINDAAATAMSLEWLSDADKVPIGAAASVAGPLRHGRYVIVSPDLGLGVSGVEIGEATCRVIDSEAGHMAFAPTDPLEVELLKQLGSVYGRVSYERLLSWQGLSELHRALGVVESGREKTLTPLEVLLYGRTGADALCARALDCFCNILGDFAGDVALALGANQGVFLSGRFILEAQEWVGPSGFRQRFESKGRLTQVVAALPTWAVVNRASALTGVSRLVLDQLALPDAAHPPQPALPAPERARAARAPRMAADILQGSCNGLLVLDADLNIVASNEGFWAGSSAPQSLHRPGCSILPCFEATAASGDWSPEAVAVVREALRVRQPFVAERSAFGGRIVRDEARPSASGGWIVTSTDITVSARRAKELEATAAELREAKADAEAATQAKSTFLATMSHEIRTPLNGVLGMVQAMAFDDLAEVQRERLDVIRQSGESLLAILNDILDISKIEAGKLELEEVEFDLAQLFVGAHSAFTALANKKGVSFALTTARRARGVYLGDPTRVRQILYNLISNALKFTEAGEVRVAADYRGGRLQLSVTDTGVGIDPDRLASLFDKFVQADASTTRHYGGTGLGLSICRELAELMGGSIAAESEPGQGACFRVSIPLVRVAAAQTSPPVTPRAREAAAPMVLKVLAAEDNTVNQLVLKTLLHQIGAELTVVDDGEQAVAAWEREAWDVILMDVQMPRLDGPGAVRLIRQREAVTGRARTPIIALTANVMTHQIIEYLAAGMDGCIGKPIQVSALLEALEAVGSGEAMAQVA